MDLGAFSVSLSVKDIYASTAFYLKLGFSIFSGAPEENWVILKNGQHLIGLFQGMFTDNMLTFNPGWDQESNELDSYLDVRDIQKKLKEQGIQLIEDVDQSIAEGPSHIMLADPDGNIILIDQHR